MAKIVDPDQLNQTTEVTFDTSAKTIDLAVAGNLNDTAPGRTSGVTHQALYSFTKEEWLATAALQSSRFPFTPIFEAKFIWTNDWQPADAQTRDLIRDGGFRIELLDDEYAVMISLQDFDNTTDQAYYWYDSTARWTGVPNNFDKTGELNEPWLIFDGTNDYRDFLKVFLRIQGKTHGYGDLVVDQGLSSLTYQAYRVPLSNSTDPNIVTSDNDIDTTQPYTDMQINYLKGTGFSTFAGNTAYPATAVVLDPARQAGGSTGGTWWFTATGGTSSASATTTTADIVVTWESYAGETQIGGEWRAFNRIVEMSATGGTATLKQFYNFGERQLRQAGDINDNALGAPNQNNYGTVDGELAMDLFDYVGSTLRTRPGVNILDFDANDTNNLEVRDITAATTGLDQDDVPVTSNVRTYPFVAAGNIVFNSALVDEPDVDTNYKMYFQYTTRATGSDIAVVSPTGANGRLTSTGGSVSLTANFATGEYMQLSGFSTATANNGLFRVTAATATDNIKVTKVNGQSMVAISATAGYSIHIDNDPYDSPDAIVVDTNAGATATGIAGQISAASIAFDFDYDNNVQGGRTANSDAPVAIIAQGLGGAQWVDGLFTITRTTGLNFPINAAVERVYANPT